MVEEKKMANKEDFYSGFARSEIAFSLITKQHACSLKMLLQE